jgi:hypothetical protein
MGTEQRRRKTGGKVELETRKGRRKRLEQKKR